MPEKQTNKIELGRLAKGALGLLALGVLSADARATTSPAAEMVASAPAAAEAAPTTPDKYAAIRAELATSERCSITSVTDHGTKLIQVAGASKPAYRRAVEVVIHRTQDAEAKKREQTYEAEGTALVTTQLQPRITGKEAGKPSIVDKGYLEVPNGDAIPRDTTKTKWQLDQGPQRIRDREASDISLWVLPLDTWEAGSRMNVSVYTSAKTFSDTGETITQSAHGVCANELVATTGKDGSVRWAITELPAVLPVPMDKPYNR